MATVRCPSCERAVEVEYAYRDWTVRCPHCAAEFVPNEAGAARPRRRPRREEREDREERDDRDDDPDEREEDRLSAQAEARAIVAGPATALEIMGWMGVLGSVGLGGLFIVIALAANGNANRNDEDEVVFVMMGMCMGVLGVPYSVVVAIGARKMRELSSRGWGLTAAILGIVSFAIFGVCGLIPAGIGVWALVTLENPVVRAAYGLNSGWRPRRRRRRDWDD